MELFVDTSALVKYYYPEEDSEQVEKLILSAKRIYLGWITPAELASALMRKVRMGDLDSQIRLLIWESFLRDIQSDSVDIAEAPAGDALDAAELIMKHGAKVGLRTLDALQLASVMRVPSARFLTADTALAVAAKAAGLKLATA